MTRYSLLIPFVLVACQGPIGPADSYGGLGGGFVEAMEVACDPQGGIVTKQLPDPGFVVNVVGCKTYEGKRVCEPTNISSWWADSNDKVGLRCADSEHDAVAIIIWAPL